MDSLSLSSTKFDQSAFRKNRPITKKLISNINASSQTLDENVENNNDISLNCVIYTLSDHIIIKYFMSKNLSKGSLYEKSRKLFILLLFMG